MKNFLLIFLTLCLLFTKNAFSQPAFIKDSLDNYIQQGLKNWQIPGLAIIIIKDGKIVVEKLSWAGFVEKNDKYYDIIRETDAAIKGYKIY